MYTIIERLLDNKRMQKSKELAICLSEGTSSCTFVKDALLYNPCLVNVIAVPSAGCGTPKIYLQKGEALCHFFQNSRQRV